LSTNTWASAAATSRRSRFPAEVRTRAMIGALLRHRSPRPCGPNPANGDRRRVSGGGRRRSPFATPDGSRTRSMEHPDEPRRTVSAAARRLGVAPGTLRTWDRRYGVGPADHSCDRHGRYSAVDMARFEVMQHALVRARPRPRRSWPPNAAERPLATPSSRPRL
jgi:hypothetical protein